MCKSLPKAPTKVQRGWPWNTRSVVVVVGGGGGAAFASCGGCLLLLLLERHVFFSSVVLRGVVLGPAAVVGLKGSPRGHGLMCKQCAKLKCVNLYMFWHFLKSGGGSVQELA